MTTQRWEHRATWDRGAADKVESPDGDGWELVHVAPGEHTEQYDYFRCYWRRPAETTDADDRIAQLESDLAAIFVELRKVRDKEEHDSPVFQDVEMILALFDDSYPRPSQRVPPGDA